jgi:putative DNA primase/helicase
MSDPISAADIFGGAREHVFADTDLGNAEYFADRFGAVLRYDWRRHRWLVWDAPTWRPDTDGAVIRRAAEAVRQRQLDALSIDDRDKRKRAMDWALKSESRERLTALVTLAQSCEPIADAGDQWDTNPWVLACPNGVLELASGTLRPGRPDDRLTMRTAVPFDPSTTAPRFEQFIAEVFDDDLTRVDWVQRALGYALTGITSEQVWFLLHGTGANGKGTLTRLFAHVLGDYAFNLPFQTFESRASGIPNDLAALVGRRFVTASETNDGTRLNEARLKSLTGEDDITARFLHGEFFSFRPVSKLFLSVNHRPVVRDLSAGFWRRLRELPFERAFTLDQTLGPALLAEAPGVLAWAVRGCLRWQAEGLGNLPVKVADAIADYRHESDVLADFIAARCVTLAGVSGRASHLFDQYVRWAEQANVARDERLSQTAFGRALTERGFKKNHTNQGASYHGIALRAAEAVA